MNVFVRVKKNINNTTAEKLYIITLLECKTFTLSLSKHDTIKSLVGIGRENC